MNKLVLCVFVLLAAPAYGQTDDYAGTNTRWNGLSTFAGLARSMGVPVHETTELDFERITTDDVVMLVYPSSLDGAWQLPEFVERGGRLVVADDFGEGSYAMALLDLDRQPYVPSGMRRLLEGNPQLPIAVPTSPGHPLISGVDELATNHPATFQAGTRGALFALEGGLPVVVHGRLGSGLWVALADPSVLINTMLEEPGNLRFASNLLAWLTSPRRDSTGPRRLWVLTGRVTASGQPADADVARGTWNGRFEDANRVLGGLNEYVTSDAVLWAIGLLLAALIILAISLWRPLSMGPPRALDGRWTGLRRRSSTSGSPRPMG